MSRAILTQALEALEKSKRSHTYCEDSWYSCPKAEDGCADDSRGPECDCGADEFNAELDKTITAIRAHLDNTKDVEPVARFNWNEGKFEWLTPYKYELHHMKPLYLSPIPPGWLRAVDEAMVCSHLGIADASDSYEVAKKKLNDLICWNIQVATDPTVNGGYVLVPEELSDEINVALGDKYGYPPYGWKSTYRRIIAMLAAAKKGE
jgi:hypothetical protein